MIDLDTAILLMMTTGGFSWFAYQCGVMDGERREYKKWYARQWHRPGCSCDISPRKP